jgi:anti-sigma factor RsiW
MHQELRHNLEDFLRGNDYSSGSELPAKLQAHLGECAECAGEFRLLQEQSQLLRSLRPAEGVEPRPGFYARVVERIEAQPATIWSVFLERKFGFRLAVASAALVALLGTYLITSEPSGPEFSSSPAAVQAGAHQAGVQNDESQQQRDAVLVDLASYRQ